jgi:hypothetical protein
MSKSSTLTSWNNFGPWEGSVFEFRSLSRVQNLEIQSARPSPPMSGPKRASTGAIDTRSHSRPPQSRSPSGDHAHSREGTGAGHRRSSLTHMGAPVLSGRGQLKGGVLDPFHFLLTSSRLPSPLLTIAGHPHSPSSPSKPGERFTVISSSSITGFWPEPPANNAEKCRSPNCRLLPHG